MVVPKAGVFCQVSFLTVSDELIQLDVTDDNEIAALQQTLNNRPLDLLINNAGTRGEQGITIGHVLTLKRNSF